MEIYNNPLRSEWEALCQRPQGGNPEILSRVESILDRVRKDGDKALAELSEEIEGLRLSVSPDGDGFPLEVPSEEISAASAKVSDKVKQAIAVAAANIRTFHEAQMPREIEVQTMPGVRCIQRPVPIGRVGLYIPGGTAPLFSTVLMLAVPASIAGCGEIVLCTPAGKDGKISPEVLYAASYCGIRRIFRLGGAQAIGAMAYGTGTVPRTDKIFGPGNRYVMAAKQLVSRVVSIDMPAGPSEVMVLADASSNPVFVASDLLSQAEHGPDSQVMLVCRDGDFAKRVTEEAVKQMESLPRAGFAEKALENSRAVVFDREEDMIDFAQAYAPEHLIIATSDAESIASRITTAGSVFIGPWAPESAGDYASGTNHTLPTSGWARSCSGVNIDSFMRKMTLQQLSRDGLSRIAPTITAMAEAEGLDAHARAVTLRMEEAAEESLKPLDREGVLSLMRPNIRSMEPYSTARDEFEGSIGVFLDANESPWDNGWNRYPDPRQKELKRKVSSIKGAPVENIFLGNGSDEAIDLVFRIFCEPGKDNAIIISPSYGMYSVAARTNDVEVRFVPLGENFSLPSKQIMETADSRSKVLFLCSPNNPSGNAFTLDEIISLVRSFRGIVVLDEAYVDFSAKGSMLSRLGEFPNLIILQTFSKAYGLAALRVGMAFADEAVIRIMDRVKYPYNLGAASQSIALEALSLPVGQNVKAIIYERDRLSQNLLEFPFVKKVWPSDANFLLVEFDDADEVYDHLLDAGIIVRNRSRVPGCSGCLRITVGISGENNRVIASLKKYEKIWNQGKK